MIRYNPEGLTSREVAESRERHGDNVITPPKDDSAWRLLAEKFRDPIIRILLLAAVLSLAIGFVHKDFTESIGIICAIILATCVGFWFEWDAQRRFRRLNRVNDDVAVKVMRDGAIREIPRREVVVGDVVYVESGETVPADGELVEAVSLKINESTLTGEPEVDKTVDEAHFDPEATYPSNVVMRGTTVADGYGVMVVTAVGDASEAGRVTEQSTVQNDEQTPLDRQLTRLSQLIGRVGIALSVLIFCVMLGKALFLGDLLEQDWLTVSQQVLHIFMVSVAIIVMAVPEGLPMSITLSLAMSMRRMLRTNNLVRKMHACETMGAVTVICTDKTGTLTQNRMHVQELVRYDDLPERDFAEIVALNSTAFLDAGGHIIGNPTEGALLEWLRGRGEDYEPLRAGAKIVDRLTFSTERKYMATIIESGVSGRRILCVKGAPEIVRAMCAADGCDERIAAQLLGFQNHAMRTLAVAWAETQASECLGAVAAGGLRFSAVAAILDPVREDVPAAVRQCLNAGIGVKIVPGDTPATAREIARQIGLWDDAHDTGPQPHHRRGSSRRRATRSCSTACRSSRSCPARGRSTSSGWCGCFSRRARWWPSRATARTTPRRSTSPTWGSRWVRARRWRRTPRHHVARRFVRLDRHGRHVGAFALPQHPAFRAFPVDDQLRGDPHLLRGGGVRNGHAADRRADSLGQYHHGHLRGDGDGLAASQRRGDGRQAPSARRVHHHARHGAHDLHVRRRDGSGAAGDALRLDLLRGGDDRAASDALLLDLRILPILEHVQRQRIRDAAFGVRLPEGLPRIFPHSAGHRRGAGVDRGAGRRSVPHRAAYVARMGGGDLSHVAAGRRR